MPLRGALAGPRLLLRRLREVMAEPVSPQARLDKIVVHIASNMVAEVCSIYFIKDGGWLELYATEGLNKDAVHRTRLKMGEYLAQKIRRQFSAGDIDVVMPIPDTSRTAALELANQLNVKYREGFMKNRYIGRTFIMPGQGQRKKSVRQKLNPIELEFSGKNVLLVDDSIVRGTTCREIIQMARDAGASKVYFASAAPAVKFPNVYGIDMPAKDELIAHGRTDQEVCDLIGADALIYQKLEDLIAAAREGNPDIEQFDCSVFNGEYVTGDIDEAYLDNLQASRSDSAKKQSRHGSTMVDLANG